MKHSKIAALGAAIMMTLGGGAALAASGSGGGSAAGGGGGKVTCTNALSVSATASESLRMGVLYIMEKPKRPPAGARTRRSVPHLPPREVENSRNVSTAGHNEG